MELWIKVNDGEIFEGNALHWADCFFSNVSIENILSFCSDNDMKVEIQIMSKNHKRIWVLK